MLEMFYREQIHTYKHRFSIKAGMVATFVDNYTVGRCDHKSVPMGFFIKDSGPSALVVEIVMGLASLKTDVFEKGVYKIQDFLYCSRNGKITNERKYRGNIILGVVNSVEKNAIGFITCLARGLENKE
jgi:hypothetical protein